jgi:hypothetical protein
MKERIKLNDSMMDILMNMSEDNYGMGVELDEMMEKVREALPNFVR